MKPLSTPAALNEAAQTEPPTAKPRTRLRAARRDDHAAVMALFTRHGWPQRSQAGWDWALFDSPARVATQADAGWLLEHGDQVVGFLGNLPVLCRHDGAPVWGATCTSYLVDDEHRAHSMRLMRAFAAQPGAAFTWSATANAHSATVYKGFRFKPAPQAQARQRLRWWADEGAAAEGLAQQVGQAWLRLPARWAGKALAMTHRWRSSSADVPGLQVQRLRAEDLRLSRTSEWPLLWSQWAKAYSSRPGLWVDRSAATWAWRLSDPDLADHLSLWALRDAHGRMLGLCAARKISEPMQGAPRAELLDWALLPGAPAGSAAMLHKRLMQWARSWQLACVDAKRWTGTAADQLAGLSPRMDELPAEGVWVLVNRAPGLPELPDWPHWSMTGIDSDDWYNTHRHQVRADTPPWAGAAATATDSLQVPSAAESSAHKSATVSTDDGSKRSISTV